MDASKQIARAGRTLTLRRFSDGTYEGPFYTEDASPIDTPIVGSVQPLTFREKLLMPEGDRVRDWIKVFTTADVRTDSDTAKADQLIVDGRAYEVQQVTDWTMPRGGTRQSHKEVNAVSVNQKTVAEG